MPLLPPPSFLSSFSRACIAHCLLEQNHRISKQNHRISKQNHRISKQNHRISKQLQILENKFEQTCASVSSSILPSDTFHQKFNFRFFCDGHLHFKMWQLSWKFLLVWHRYYISARYLQLPLRPSPPWRSHLGSNAVSIFVVIFVDFDKYYFGWL